MDWFGTMFDENLWFRFLVLVAALGVPLIVGVAAYNSSAQKHYSRGYRAGTRDAQAERAERYGAAHSALRDAWKSVIAKQDVDCMEAVCIMPTRRIAAGSSGTAWDLAHDHSKQGDHHYLGPAHKQCNQAEALARGVTWEGAPTLADLRASVGHRAAYPGAEREEGDLLFSYTDEHGGEWDVVWTIEDWEDNAEYWDTPIWKPEHRLVRASPDHPERIREREAILRRIRGDSESPSQ